MEPSQGKRMFVPSCKGALQLHWHWNAREDCAQHETRNVQWFLFLEHVKGLKQVTGRWEGSLLNSTSTAISILTACALAHTVSYTYAL